MKAKKHKCAITIGIVLVTVVFSAEFRAEDKTSEKTNDTKGDIEKTPRKNNLELSHKTHINFVNKLKGTKKDCTDCHVLNEVTDSYTLNEEFCDRCHLPSSPLPWDPPIKARALKDLTFKHTEHKDLEPSQKEHIGQVQCIECHETTMNDEHKQGTPFVTSERCISCHSKEKVALPEKKCSSCHLEENKIEIEPPSHKKNWTIRHGAEKRWSATYGHGKQCELCHSRSSCVSCHQTNRPRNHTGMWRIRMHGTTAKWDRQKCKTCHQTGSCISCHRRTPPLTHRGAWTSIHGRALSPGYSERCATCHNQGWCTSCHTGAK